jgi:hypothetical protein
MKNPLDSSDDGWENQFVPVIGLLTPQDRRSITPCSCGLFLWITCSVIAINRTITKSTLGSGGVLLEK